MSGQGVLPAGGDPLAPAEARWRAACDVADRDAPYLAALLGRFPQAREGPQWAIAALSQARAAAVAAPEAGFERGMAILRRAKAETHLAAALLDLSGEAELLQTTAALTAFADAAVSSAIAMAAQALAERGDLAAPEPSDPRGPIPGFIVLAMGKGGAGELNYSSDVDLSLFFDPEAMRLGAGREARVVAQRVAQLLVRALDAVTADGYVMRADLRLRPDPNSTSPAVSVPAALNYYQSVGQNWERAAFIKARPCAGDLIAAAAFLAALSPFVWRRHLDYAAIEDINAIKRRIRLSHGAPELADPAVDIKLAPGGIRDIELFAQTQQLIRGGRAPHLRCQRTLEALAALTQAEALAPPYAAALSSAYVALRHVEHRIQMRHDEQTHDLPKDPAARDAIARLCGLPDHAALDDLIRRSRETVARIDRALFEGPAPAADPLADLRFMGLDDDAETLRALGQLGFADPARVTGAFRRWLAGGARALRAERARRLLVSLTPAILRACGDTQQPDLAFERFALLLDGLAAGVPLLSLFEARPEFLSQTVAALALSARLAGVLARRPALLDALAEADFHRPVHQDPPETSLTALRSAVPSGLDFEAAMNAARRAQRESAFRIAMQALKGVIDAGQTGAAFTALAEASLIVMAEASLADVIAARGPQPGCFAVLGLGKLGGRELTATSDLDLMVVYDAPQDSFDSGEAQAYYARLTQRLITAMTAPTEEGALYEIDMKLRPSGSKGPVAVRLSSFARYYRQEAWTWELLALTRARPIAGDGQLRQALQAEIADILAAPRDRAAVMQDVAAMRALMQRERPPVGAHDVKLRPGGLVDVEFIAQALQLVGQATPHQGTREALAAADMENPDHAACAHAFALCAAVQQAARLCLNDPLALAQAGEATHEFVARFAGLGQGGDLDLALDAACAAAREVFVRLIGWPSDGTPASAR